MYKQIIFALFLAHTVSANELSVVPKVDLERYLGKWYEIARFDNKYQKECLKSAAEYSKMGDELIQIKNSCTLADGKMKEVIGRARVEDKATNAKLKVNFVPPFLRFFGIGWGHYWIIDLDENYHYVVVSEPKKSSLWILSRTPDMSKATYEGIINRLMAKGFDTSKLIISGEIK